LAFFNKIINILVWFLKWAVIIAIWSLVIGALVVVYYAWDLPSIDGLSSTAAKSRRPGIIINDAEGGRLASYGDLYGRRLDIKELPSHLVQAVVAIEDRRFFKHKGFDGRGLLRAMTVNLRKGRFVQGGSTLTQQLAKNLFLTPERTIDRKIKELILAFWLEHKFTKEDLLSIYLNRVYLGSGTYGVEAASQRYFGISARDLGVYQSAILAGLLRAPSRLNPAYNLEASLGRANIVLSKMVEQGFLSYSVIDKLNIKNLSKKFKLNNLKYLSKDIQKSEYNRRYFTDWVLGRTVAIASSSDLTVNTTLSPYLQRLAYKSIKKIDIDSQVALISMTPYGKVCAMIGGRNYSESQFNRATQALRQPGSAFKPIVYLPALEAGMKPDTIVLDAPITVEGWTPRNFSGRFYGKISLLDAVARSINTTAVRVAEDMGRDNVLKAARRLGITAELTTHPSLSLGAGEVTLLELTAAYAVFANGGSAVLPYGLVEVRTDKELLYSRRKLSSHQVIEPKYVDVMEKLLRAVIEKGTGRAAQFGHMAAGKSGTSQQSRDAWFIGYTDKLVTGVWVGNDNGSPMQKLRGRSITGGGVPAKIWQLFMSDAHKAELATCR
jgi:penicillin-binding protein 1A